MNIVNIILLVSIDDVYELWFKGGSAHKKSINVGLFGKVLAVTAIHRT